jgi:hypothetical protein
MSVVMTTMGSIEVDAGGADTEVVVRFEIVHDAPIGEPANVLGPSPFGRVAAGVYLGIWAGPEGRAGSLLPRSSWRRARRAS